MAEATTRSRDASAEVRLGSLPRHIGYLLRRAQLQVFQDVIRALAEVDLRPAQFSVLVVIGENPGLRQAQLGEALAIQTTNLVGVLDELERRGLVARLPSLSDRRSRALHLTLEGARILRRAQTLADRNEARILRKLGADGKRRLAELLTHLAASDGEGENPIRSA
jgi:DNA-binding MarR family transcriptional regulator